MKKHWHYYIAANLALFGCIHQDGGVMFLSAGVMILGIVHILIYG